MIPNSRSPYYVLAAMGVGNTCAEQKSLCFNAMSLLVGLQAWFGQDAPLLLDMPMHQWARAYSLLRSSMVMRLPSTRIAPASASSDMVLSSENFCMPKLSAISCRDLSS